jgi:DNA-binding MarR family transcriptional regulator
MQANPSLEERVLAAIERLAQARRAHTQDMATAHGLSPLQLEVLRCLHDPTDRPRGSSSLARELDVSIPTITDAVATLRSKNLVTENNDHNDARRRILALTSRGRAIAINTARERLSIAESLQGLGTQRQAATLHVLLQLIAEYHRRGVLGVDRSCATCRFHRTAANGSQRCELLGVALKATDLRVNCPEHEAMSPQ